MPSSASCRDAHAVMPRPRGIQDRTASDAVVLGVRYIDRRGAGMDLEAVDDSESRFAAYVEGLVSVIGHSDRAGPLWDYCVGLVMPGERKSVEPMAAVTAPDRTAVLHFVGQSPWSDE